MSKRRFHGDCDHRRRPGGRRRCRIGRRSSGPSRSATRPRRLCRRRAGAGASPRRPSRADVPVYLDGVGTVRALNTVTVRAAGRRQADRGRLQGRPGRQARRRAGADRSRPPIRPQLDQAIAKKAQDEAPLANARLDLERYTRLVATELGRPPAARHPAGDRRAARSAGAARPGGDRQRPRDPRLHHHHRADRRPHRHPPGRRGQHRARLGRDRHRRASRSSSRSRCCSPCRSSSSATSTAPSPRARWRSRRSAPTTRP